MDPSAKTERPLRADAERNRLRILDAAAELFAERGLQVSLDDVAERAGVGVGTVYRRFPDREALVDAVLESRVAEFVGIAEDAVANPDPWEGVKNLIERGAEFHGRNRALKELMFSAPGGRAWVDRVRRRMRPLTGGLVKAAQEQGKLRGDLNTLDVPLTMLMLASAIEFTAHTDADNWRRLLGIVLDGLITQRDAPTPLDADPLTQTELTQAMKRSSRA
jgi:AcrR family transcriptional regulator